MRVCGNTFFVPQFLYEKQVFAFFKVKKGDAQLHMHVFKDDYPYLHFSIILRKFKQNLIYSNFSKNLIKSKYHSSLHHETNSVIPERRKHNFLCLVSVFSFG